MFAFRVFILSFFVSFWGNSQGYYHSPNDTLWASTTLDQQVTMNITQVHTSNDTLQFIWQKVYVDLPFGWEATICDNSNCNLALIDGDTTLPVLPGDDGLLLIHCTPHVTNGIGIIQYSMYEIHQPAQIDTLTWIIDANELYLSENSSISGSFSVENNSLIWIGESLVNPTLILVSMDGTTIHLDTKNSTNGYSLSFLKPGLYWVLLENEGENYSQKIYYDATY
ncbi:MAG: hypothetical protein RLZ33_2554 [Bacteroidota bacterium]|jgi:hypothetical protein